jgi:hypothetical protein
MSAKLRRCECRSELNVSARAHRTSTTAYKEAVETVNLVRDLVEFAGKIIDRISKLWYADE